MSLGGLNIRRAYIIKMSGTFINSLTDDQPGCGPTEHLALRKIDTIFVVAASNCLNIYIFFIDWLNNMIRRPDERSVPTRCRPIIWALC